VRRLGGLVEAQTCAAANRRAVNPLTGEVVSQAYVGTTVPGSGSIANGMFKGGLAGEKAGWYYNMPYLSWGPRLGVAWDVTGDRKTAIRAATGIFYNFVNQGQYLWSGVSPLLTQDKIVRNATIDDIANFAKAGTEFASSPQQGNLPDGFPLALHGNSLTPGAIGQIEQAFPGRVVEVSDAELLKLGMTPVALRR